MNFFKRRKLRKYTKHFLQEARLSRNMRMDRAEPRDLEALAEAEQAVHAAWVGDPDEENIERRLEELSAASSKVYPQRSYSRVRENIEILAVAVIIAMGFRTYFLQPFKIPTGSMQPTLYGIHVEQDVTYGLLDRPPFRYLKFLLTGDRYVNVRAEQDGIVTKFPDRVARKDYIQISSRDRTSRSLQRYYPGMKEHYKPGQVVSKGQLLAEGLVRSGDHIFVDKMRYNFTRPKRGQVVVLLTREIRHPDIRETDHYIKRLAGMPGEEISIDPPHLVVDGRKLEEPEAFRYIVEDLGGYVPAQFTAREAKLKTHADVYTLADDSFLPLGDNTRHSLDGRYFGGVPVANLVGPAFVVYWPFGPRWGWAK